MATWTGHHLTIRPYRSSDLDDVVHIFRETAAPELRNAGDPVLHYGSYIWCRPYLFLEPDNCFVVDNGNGRAVGYIIGTPDTRSFVQRWNEGWKQKAQAAGIQRPGPDEPRGWQENLPNTLRMAVHLPEQMLHEDQPELLRMAPAHFHIDVLPPYQRQGMGRKLIATLCERFKQQGAQGAHLIMAADNEDAANFYPAVGFSRFPRVLDGGVSGQEGRDKNTIWMFKAL